MDLSIFKGLNTNKMVYFISQKNGVYYIWQERVYNILVDSSIYKNLPRCQYFLNKKKAFEECRKLNKDGHSRELIGFSITTRPHGQ